MYHEQKRIPYDTGTCREFPELTSFWYGILVNNNLIATCNYNTFLLQH
jgi:hypothetical protein